MTELRFTCECCFVPVTPLTIERHQCNPKVKEAREKIRDEANKEINEIHEVMGSDDFEYAFKGMSNEDILVVMRDDIL